MSKKTSHSRGKVPIKNRKVCGLFYPQQQVEAIINSKRILVIILKHYFEKKINKERIIVQDVKTKHKYEIECQQFCI